MRTYALIAVLAFGTACAGSLPNLDVSLDGNAVSVSGPGVDATVGVTGASVKTPAFQAGFTACVEADGPFAPVLRVVPFVGELVLKFISCPAE